ncbi:LuxR C-terminal-related transcriptional regulator [Paenibacillus dendrobii]|nr:LuxR C-terminal-related transcriptional regulator [Paenibacillus dendrobii]
MNTGYPSNTQVQSGNLSSYVLSAKASIPLMAEKDIIRQRLMNHLDESIRCKLTLITAPAGFGKTTLVSSWIHVRSLKAAWVSLDDGDNEWIRFWSCITEAIERCVPGFSENIMRGLQAYRSSSMEAMMSFYLNEICTITEPFVLVLDDYHLIRDASVLESLAFFLEYLPEHIRLMIISRAHPSLPLSRLRVRKQLSEVGAADLRFTIDEITALQEKSLSNVLLPEHIALLEQKTEGWAAGLILAFLSMEGRSDVTPFIQSFSGNHRYIFDYLMDEVLLRQTEEFQVFLLQTSILNYMNASLTDAVTGRSDSKHLFHALERSHMFFIPLDDTRTWYRYHHLFSEMLQNRLLNRYGLTEVNELHRRAYQWYEQHGFITEAVNHMFEADEKEHAAICIEQNFPLIIQNGDETSLQRWLKQLPLESIVSRPDLFYYQAGRLAASGNIPEAKSLLERTLHLLDQQKDLFSEEERRELTLRVGMYRASVAYYQGDVDTFIDLLDSNREGLVKFPSIVNVVNLGEALLYRGPIGFGGRLKKMAYLSARASESETRRASIHGALQGHGFVFLADLYYEWNRLEEAESILEQALQMYDPESSHHLGVAIPGIILHTKIKQAMGDFEAAEEILQQATKHIEKLRSPHWQLLLEACFARFQLTRGNIDAVEKWVEHRHIQTPDKTSVAREYENLTLVRLWIHRKSTEEAVKLLRKLEKDAKRTDRLGSQIEILLLLALAYQAEGKHISASESMEKALQLASQQGYIRIFLDEGSSLYELLSQYLKQYANHDEEAADYARKLLPMFTGLQGDYAGMPLHEGSEFAVSLTNREKEILNYIAAGHSNDDIARSLYLSVGTIKGYTYNLYQKLGVKNRVQAISKAMELNLL